jgi:hypothetical protein
VWDISRPCTLTTSLRFTSLLHFHFNSLDLCSPHFTLFLSPYFTSMSFNFLTLFLNVCLYRGSPYRPFR